MNYLLNYVSLIESRKNLYRKYCRDSHFELHHIIPRSLGGTDLPENLVLLTHREHYLAHYMLAKAFPCAATKRAFLIMSKAPYNQGNIFCSRMYEKLKEEFLNDIRKKVVCLETGEVFSSRTAAAIAVGKVKNSGEDIYKAIKGGDAKTCGGYHWAEFEENIDYTQNKWFGLSNTSYSLIRLEDLKIYSTWKECAEDLDCTVGCISSALRTKGTAKGYHLEKYNPLKKYTSYSSSLDKNKRSKEKFKVVCLETGKIFNSNIEAGKWAGIKKGPIRDFTTETNFSAGLHWEIFKEGVDYSTNKWYHKKRRTNKIICLETKEIFSSLKDVYNKKGLHVHNVLTGNAKTCGGYHWGYIYEDIKSD